MGARLLHRAVYEDTVGAIPPGFVVHHVDGNKANNDPVNLETMSIAEHMRLHPENLQKATAVGRLREKTPKQMASIAKALEVRMAKPAVEIVCRICGEVAMQAAGAGRGRLYCSVRCLKAAFRARHASTL